MGIKFDWGFLKFPAASWHRICNFNKNIFITKGVYHESNKRA
jgi:hypothetical protein